MAQVGCVFPDESRIVELQHSQTAVVRIVKTQGTCFLQRSTEAFRMSRYYAHPSNRFSSIYFFTFIIRSIYHIKVQNLAHFDASGMLLCVLTSVPCVKRRIHFGREEDHGTKSRAVP